jgi:putative transposase
MQRSKVEIYLHFAWATWRREAFITPAMERNLYRCMEMEARRLGCQVLAVGGTADHVHLVVKIPATIGAAKIMQQVKGVSSCFARDHCRPDHIFGWQDNYGVLSVSPCDRKQVIRYVENQKHHHASGDLWPEAEEMSEMADEPDTSPGP